MPETIWFRDDSRPRRPRLSRDRIVAAAVALLDAEGVPGFSMRALAARLRAGTMSLYEYVQSKEDVLDLALDEVFGEIALSEGPTWRETVVRQLTRSRAVMRRHPWVPALTATRPLIGPNALAGSRLFYSTLAAAGLTGPDLAAAVGTLSSYVNGYVAAENTWWTTVRTPAADAAIRTRVASFLSAHATELSQQAHVTDADFDRSFRRGLTIILDGIESRLPPRPADPRTTRRTAPPATKPAADRPSTAATRTDDARDT
ncbi:MAG TPA: TetR/AcrR family transcriptional regulator C-terminal domain-containing protein [Nonomuraea sp.]|nr:TetR/AcrR family transcriptional regulator C-terminal domain-containing protein [Nonomuraea sp.]